MAKICFLNIFEGLEGGGEIYLSRLIKSCISASENNDLTLLSPPCPCLDLNKEHGGIRTIRILGVLKNKDLNNIGRFIRTIFQVNSYLHNERPDYLLLNGERAVYIAPFLRKKRTKIIGIRHMLIDSKFKAYLAKSSFTHCDKIVTISHYHKKNYLSYIGNSFERKIEVIYNSVDTTYFVPTKLPDTSIIRFIQIGTLESRKGPMDALKAFNLLYKSFTNIRLTFVGQGILEVELKDFIVTQRLEGVVEMLGYKDDVRILLDSSHILLLPSYNEGLPLSILESFSCGRPVISTSIAGIPEIIDIQKNGFMISPGNITALEEYMEFFCQHPKAIYQMGEDGRKKVIQSFDDKEWKEKWLNLLNNL